eukprot:243686-Prymnesium_polylepis.1
MEALMAEVADPEAAAEATQDGGQGDVLSQGRQRVHGARGRGWAATGNAGRGPATTGQPSCSDHRKGHRAMLDEGWLAHLLEPRDGGVWDSWA